MRGARSGAAFFVAPAGACRAVPGVASGAAIRVALAGLLLVLVACGSPARASAAGPESTPSPHPMQPTRDRLAPPEMPAHPTQAELGQELTDEFRTLLGPQDENCWQSKCHAANHPPGGFVFPKVVPAVITPTLAAQFPTALALHDFIKAKMPYNRPDGLTEEEYWQLTAFLVRANGAGPLPATLDVRTAAAVRSKPAAPGAAPWKIVGVPVVVVLAGLGGWLAWRRSQVRAPSEK